MPPTVTGLVDARVEVILEDGCFHVVALISFFTGRSSIC